MIGDTTKDFLLHQEKYEMVMREMLQQASPLELQMFIRHTLTNIPPKDILQTNPMELVPFMDQKLIPLVQGYDLAMKGQPFDKLIYSVEHLQEYSLALKTFHQKKQFTQLLFETIENFKQGKSVYDLQNYDLMVNLMGDCLFKTKTELCFVDALLDTTLYEVTCFCSTIGFDQRLALVLGPSLFLTIVGPLFSSINFGRFIADIQKYLSTSFVMLSHIPYNPNLSIVERPSLLAAARARIIPDLSVLEHKVLNTFSGLNFQKPRYFLNKGFLGVIKNPILSLTSFTGVFFLGKFGYLNPINFFNVSLNFSKKVFQTIKTIKKK
jgi:hypothetical protein